MDQSIQMPTDAHQFRSALISFPLEDEFFRLALFSFKKILEDADLRAKYILMIPEKYRPLYRYSMQNVIFYDPLKFDTLPTFKPVELLINLNPGFSLPMDQFLNTVRARYRIGFKSDYSDIFYNIQFDAGKAAVLERIYHHIGKMISS
ncbi:MAG: hypothetical protein GXO91_05620 [FCB group bacterium]|nr:hypothetical protein [FCB group bacterium]